MKFTGCIFGSVLNLPLHTDCNLGAYNKPKHRWQLLALHVYQLWHLGYTCISLETALDADKKSLERRPSSPACSDVGSTEHPSQEALQVTTACVLVNVPLLHINFFSVLGYRAGIYPSFGNLGFTWSLLCQSNWDTVCWRRTRGHWGIAGQAWGCWQRVSDP